MARDIELAVVAADFACRDARVATRGIVESSPPDKIAGWAHVDPRRVGCNIGAGLICTDLDELTAAMVHRATRITRSTWPGGADPKTPTKSAAWATSHRFGCSNICPTCSPATSALFTTRRGRRTPSPAGRPPPGWHWARPAAPSSDGAADLALVGGCEAKVNPMALMRLSLVHQLATRYNDRPQESFRPLDQDANGMVIADGGAVLVIEELEHAKKRGATIYCEIVGLGGASSAKVHLTAPPESESIAVAMRKSLGDAGIEAAQVQMVVPLGSSVPVFDRADAVSIQEVFGEPPRKPPWCRCTAASAIAAPAPRPSIWPRPPWRFISRSFRRPPIARTPSPICRCRNPNVPPRSSTHW